MPTALNIYTFDNFVLNERSLELKSGFQVIELTAAEYQLLLFFVKNPKIPHRYGDLYELILGMEGRSKENTIPTHVSNLRKKLRSHSDRNLIKNITNIGYKFDVDVEPGSDANMPSSGLRKDYLISRIFDEEDTEEAERHAVNEETPSVDQENTEQPLEFGTREFTGAAIGMLFAGALFFTGYQLKSCRADCFEQNVYITFASSFYAVLTGIGVFLECAYKFDRYGWRAIKMLPSIFLVAAGAMFAALAAAEYHLPDKIAYAFVSGCVLLITGAGISCFLAGYILPGEPITAARKPTQAAFAAFCKNILIYFFPIYTIFGLLVFCLIYSSAPAARNVAYPIGLFVVLLIFFVISHFSTNVLLQNLLTPKDGDEYRYYGMFSSLIMFRAIFMFGAAFVSLIYYFIYAAGH